MLTETQSPALFSRQLSGYTVFTVPATSLGRAGEGVLLAVRQQLPFSVSHWQTDHANSTIWLTLKPAQSRQQPLTVGVCYIPPDSHHSAQLGRRSAQVRFESLAAHIAQLSSRGHVLLAGDFNARVGSASQPWVTDLSDAASAQLHNSDSTVNSHGRKLLSLCEEAAMVICTGRTPGDTPAQPSFKARSNTAPSRLDHALVDCGLFAAIQTCGVGLHRQESDHFPLELQLLLTAPASPASLPPPQTSILSWAWDSSQRGPYAEALLSGPCQTLISDCTAAANAHQHSTPATGNAQLELADAKFRSTIDTAAQAAPLRRKQPWTGRQPPHLSCYPWWNPRCLLLQTQLRQAKLLTPRAPHIRLLERRYQSHLRHSRDNFAQRGIVEFSQLLKINPRKFWQMVRLPSMLLPAELQHPAAWDSYLSKLTAPPAQSATQLPAPHTAQPPAPAHSLNQPLTLAEVEVGLQQLHNGRSGALHGYTSELLRYAKLVPTPDIPAPAHLLAPCLVVLFNAAFSTGQVPQSWKTSLVTPIFKKGDATDTANYRPISVGEPISRLYASIMVQRLVKYTEQQQLRSSTQTGYRPELGTIHPAFALQHVIDKHRHASQPLYLCFVDLRSAYDKVQWQLLWGLLQRLGVHGHMLGAIQSLYHGSLLSMRVGGQCGQSQSPSIGLRQGCPLSATLFGIFIDGLHHHLQTTAPAAGVQIRHLKLTDLVYADDICLMASSPEHLQALIDALVVYCAALHMEINVSKTKVMVVAKPAARAAPRMAAVFTCGGLPVQQVDTFKYLGLHFHESGSISHLITPLKAKAARSWAVVQQRHSQLQCGKTVNLTLSLLQSILVPSLHYGCQLWGMHSPTGPAKTARADLQSIYDKFLRRICGVNRATPSAMLLEELALSPLQVFWWQQTLEFWNTIAASPVSSLFHTILLDNLNDAFHVGRGAKNFASSVATCLQSVGHLMPHDSSVVPVMEVDALVDALRAHLHGTPDYGMYCPRAAPSTGVVSCTYHHWFKPFSKRRRYCQLPVSGRRMQRFLQFRLGSHSLPIVAGRFAGGQHVARTDRVCTHCGGVAVADELHMIHECPVLQPLRQRYAALFSTNTDTMRSFFAQQDHMQVFNFVLDCLDFLGL